MRQVLSCSRWPMASDRFEFSLRLHVSFILDTQLPRPNILRSAARPPVARSPAVQLTAAQPPVVQLPLFNQSLLNHPPQSPLHRHSTTATRRTAAQPTAGAQLPASQPPAIQPPAAQPPASRPPATRSTAVQSTVADRCCSFVVTCSLTRPPPDRSLLSKATAAKQPA